MFNGIIYNQGTIKSIRKNPKYVSGSLVIEIISNIKFKKQDIGESVCCDGVCLTLIKIKKKSFLFYLSKETLKRSNFKYAKVGKHINIEKSLLHGQKISGHYVQGHVDSTAKIKNIGGITSNRAFFHISALGLLEILRGNLSGCNLAVKRM